VKLERDRCKKGNVRDCTMEEVWISLPNWMKLMMKDEKTLNEGLENDSENQDNMDCRSLLPFSNLMGCSPFWAKASWRFH